MKEPQLYSQIDDDFKTKYAQEYQYTNQRIFALERKMVQLSSEVDKNKGLSAALSFFEGA